MKIICVGRNYTEHIAELQNEKPDAPVIFMKPDTALLKNGLDFYLPEFSSEIHHEVELVVKISKVGKYIAEKFAPNYYEQLTLGIDFTARDIQRSLKEKGLPWEKAKAFDNSAYVGQWVSKKSLGDLNDIHFSLNKNQEKVQLGHSAKMLWKIDELIAYVSKFFTLKTGDLIFTGTPAGVSEIQRGDFLEGHINNQEIFNLSIK
ncbi:fumarylacetoacetate hydrolase family protein [Galbibacter sp.]|jgi:2-keto-4-pentenoate hydratase/2-oxohepta-3-ene-1,7-dioic acid hydratase in catechol pathway|uniref:fumarylacetoacetate hydrolase family protein n=1 Tax=Galbibacter sp. TaxID=2918471 RepID=UPI003A905B3E